MSVEKQGGSSKPQIQHHKITLPKGGGAISGIGEKFQANAVTGTGTFSVPIPVTPSRGGFQPALSLGYDSGSGNGVFGFGWSLDVPNVSRKTAQGLPQYLDPQESDTFLLSGAEDLVPLRNADGSMPDPVIETEDSVTYSVSLYRPRIEGLYARIERWKRTSAPSAGDVHWRATTRDNVTSIYGKSSSARIADPAKPARVFKWLLEESRDAKGNVIRYAYKVEDQANVTMTPAEKSRYQLGTYGANRHLARVSYGIKAAPSGATEFHFHIVLDYGDHPDDSTSGGPSFATTAVWPARQDPFSDHRAGFEIRTYRLCRRVLVFHEFDELDEAAPVPVRSLELTFDENPVATKLTSIRQRGYKQRTDGTFETKAFPAVTYTYSEAVIDTQVRKLDPKSLENLPQGLGGAYQWVDLHGEGLSGILAEQGDAWYYKRNEGNGRFGPMVRLTEKPVAPQLGNRAQLVDVDGDGNTELVVNSAQFAGFYAFVDGKWESFQVFRKRLNLDVDSPWVKQIDLTGDGRPDILLAEDNVFTWHESLGREGYAPARKVAHPLDEAKGPRLIFAEPVQTIFLADMTGDGLTDIVRIRASGICYWPNLGYGKFGPKVVMDKAPVLAPPDLFNPRYVRLGDVDGSGTADLFYFGGKRPKVWLNRAGNGYDAGHELPAIAANNLSSVDVIDLLGKGTSCVVWSTQLPNAQQMRYVDLMAAGKPHLLTQIDNGMGKVVEITYAPSTEDYLRDRGAGAQWITKLPFPVHVLRRVETRDLVGGTKLHTLYKYHHGYFDGAEREFRGFGMVEALDTETFETFAGTDQGEHYVTPVLTKTWFHNGAFLKQSTISARYKDEYFPGVDANPDVLPDTFIEGEELLSTDERREACRALKGHTLRQEVWEWDPVAEKPTGIDPDDPAPYSVAESNYTVKRLQPKGAQKHAVFRVDPRETITWHYEQNADDPRIAHDLTLEVDDYGSVLKSVGLAYPRRVAGEPEQAKAWATLVETDFANRPDEESWYRIGVQYEKRTFELTGLVLPGTGYLGLEDLRAQLATATEIPYEQAPGTGVQRRLVEHSRQRFYDDTLSGALALGEINALSLPHEAYQLAFTPGLLTEVYGDRVDSTILTVEGGYVLEDGAWWMRSGRAVFDAAKFFLPVQSIDPFGGVYTVTYDAYAMLAVETRDPLDNTATAVNDYRLCAPWQLTDPNGNRSAVAHDAIGMVVRSAVMGKDGAGEGDTLDDPTSTFEYDLDRFGTSGKPVYAKTRSREVHGDPASKWQESYAYSDGFGRAIMTKVQAEPGLAPALNPDGTVQHDAEGNIVFAYTDHRWVGTGRTVFDNKQNPVKQYEPFFSSTHEYEDEAEIVEWGVTPILHYDPLSRLIQTDFPNGTQAKVEFDPWLQRTFDANDAVEGTTWLAERQDPGAPVEEQRAATLALAHADTPTIAEFDTLGRTFLTIADNGTAGQYETRNALDIEGNVLSVTDALGVVTRTQRYDVAGRVVRTDGPDTGARVSFADVTGKPRRAWDSREQAFRSVYDALQRPTHALVREGAGDEQLVTFTVYGEAHEEATERNLRGQVYAVYDSAGVANSARFDFKGNLLEASRTLALAYQTTPDWISLSALTDIAAIEAAAAALLNAETFATATAYDALNRPVSITTPDASVTKPVYNEANLLEAVNVAVRGGASTPVVTNLDYNAKGQRVLCEYANGTSAAYTYDEKTFRLKQLVTTRSGDGAKLQDLRYTYDPVGNIVELQDHADWQPLFTTQPVSGDGKYVYDAIYRLVSAEGREHPGQQPVPDDPPRGSIPHPNDLQALLRYDEQYEYDAVGNITRLVHHADGGGWTRRYQYAYQVSGETACNRLLRTSAPGDPDGTLSCAYTYNAHGSMASMPHLAAIDWDYGERMRHADKGGGGNVYFTYDAAGQRVRKVYEHSGLVEERIYLGGFELYRKRASGSTTIDLERETLHLMDDKRRVGMVETKTIDTVDGGTPSTRWRYQLDNHLGSSSLEIDQAGAVIAYEEYHPFGSTAFHIADGAAEVSAKRYRYTGKEKDEETGLYYHGARYYAPWLCRWTAADPAGMVDGTNQYVYVRNNPIRGVDPTGTQDEDKCVDQCTMEPETVRADKPNAADKKQQEQPQEPQSVQPDENEEMYREAEAEAHGQSRDWSGLREAIEDPHKIIRENYIRIKRTKEGFEGRTIDKKKADRMREIAERDVPIESVPSPLDFIAGGIGNMAVRGLTRLGGKLAVRAGESMLGEAAGALKAPTSLVKAPVPTPGGSIASKAGGYGSEDIAFGLTRPGSQPGGLLKFAGEATPGTRAPLLRATSEMATGPNKNLAIASDTLRFAKETLRQTGGRLRFNLSGFDTAQALTRGSANYNSVTSAEFRGILGDTFLRVNVSFYRNGVDVTAEILRGVQ